MSSTTFKRIVWAHYKKQGRHDLPWRKTHDPYKILVSEVMLQQTQVERVIPFYKNFLKQFPNVRALAKAPLAEVLKAWQGLGYNRRAKMLHGAAKEVVEKNEGKFPKTKEELQMLPGIGPYTAGAVAAFAYNQDGIFIETNIRTVVTHHFFRSTGASSLRSARAARPIQHLSENVPAPQAVSDREILQILEKLHPAGKSREWYSALMDYGAYLKKSGVQINSRSKHYTKQSKFNGSTREARGAILRTLAEGPAPVAMLRNILGPARRDQIATALTALTEEGFVVISGKHGRLSGG